jgi:hypothetical protein
MNVSEQDSGSERTVFQTTGSAIEEKIPSSSINAQVPILKISIYFAETQ